MLQIIFKIFLILVIVFCLFFAFILIYSLITDKEYRKWAWDDLKRRSKKKSPKWRREDTEYYKRTGKRHFLGRDHRNDYKDYYGD